MIDSLRRIVRRTTGPMTAELDRVPGGFGLGAVPRRLTPASTANLICGFCATGCGLRAHLGDDGTAINLTPDPDYPVNLGMACPKGWEALAPLRAPDRATHPLARAADGTLRPVTWTDAASRFVDTFKALLERHGPESVAFLSTGQMCTEEMALLGAFFKFGMGALHGDSNTRQCMATAHVAYKESFGFDAPPYTYADFEESDVLVFVGANPCIAHPILWQRVLRNPKRPAIVVVDPRRTETAVAATHHLALRPKTDLVLLYGLAHLSIRNGWIDADFVREHTRGFEEFRDFVRDVTPEKVAAECGLTQEELLDVASTIGRGKAVSFWWTMGVNQGHEAVRTAQAIIDLALVGGHIGKPGTGANSITGQCNAMGSRLFGNTTSLFGGRRFADARHRAEVGHILGVPADRIPSTPSHAYDRILDDAASGKIKALWIVATNTTHSWIDAARVREAFDKLEFLVVQDLYATTATARHAHLFLPAAGWGEKEGTFINSERRIGAVRRVARAPGQALSDFAIFRLLGEAWGCGPWFDRWDSPAAVFERLKELSRGTPCDFGGIEDFDHLDRVGGIQWPFPETIQPAPGSSAPATERRLFADGRFFTEDGRARIVFDAPRPVPEAPDAEYPLILLTGRGTSAQWHTNTRTGKSAILRQLYPAEAYVEMHADDARRLGVESGTEVRIASRRGSLKARVVVSGSVRAGQVFVPMHYLGVNELAFPAYDPHSRQPSYKHCAVRIDPARTGRPLESIAP
ncbi:MAG: nitrate reductase [Verrucomicrobiales bacterium]|nr:nitrate reductase [Verrucomicrobiales bacterium]